MTSKEGLPTESRWKFRRGRVTGTVDGRAGETSPGQIGDRDSPEPGPRRRDPESKEYQVWEGWTRGALSSKSGRASLCPRLRVPLGGETILPPQMTPSCPHRWHLPPIPVLHRGTDSVRSPTTDLRTLSPSPARRLYRRPLLVSQSHLETVPISTPRLSQSHLETVPTSSPRLPVPPEIVSHGSVTRVGVPRGRIPDVTLLPRPRVNPRPRTGTEDPRRQARWWAGIRSHGYPVGIGVVRRLNVHLWS